MSTMTAAAFTTWLDTFVDEKGLDREHIFTVEGPTWGDNLIPLQCVIDVAAQASPADQSKIEDTLVKIDILNGDPMHFFEYIAKGIAR